MAVSSSFISGAGLPSFLPSSRQLAVDDLKLPADPARAAAGAGQVLDPPLTMNPTTMASNMLDRGHRASKDQNPGNEETFKFIPTLMVSGEAQSSKLTAGPAITMYTRSVLPNVPTDEVNFDDVVDNLNDMGDAESACARASRA